MISMALVSPKSKLFFSLLGDSVGVDMPRNLDREQLDGAISNGKFELTYGTLKDLRGFSPIEPPDKIFHHRIVIYVYTGCFIGITTLE